MLENFRAIFYLLAFLGYVVNFRKPRFIATSVQFLTQYMKQVLIITNLITLAIWEHIYVGSVIEKQIQLVGKEQKISHILS